ncbi:hypothetical protein, partial [Serratia marcescens]|uniref:hypothetical protein n=1 Tax=Serratia marcescens TaxID=615 RepID=UPI001954FCED
DLESSIALAMGSGCYIDNVDFAIHKLNVRKSRVAIIGGGPAGIAIAFILAFKGYDITICLE